MKAPAKKPAPARRSNNATRSAAKASKQIEDLRTTLSAIDAELKACQRAGAISLARGFVEIRFLKDQIETLAKEFGAMFEGYSRVAVPEQFEDEGITSLPLDIGFRVGVAAKLHATMKKSHADEAFEWLRANNLGAIIGKTVALSNYDTKDATKIEKWLHRNKLEGGIVQSVHPQTLSATAREMRAELNIELPPKLFSTADVYTTSVTKLTSK